MEWGYLSEMNLLYILALPLLLVSCDDRSTLLEKEHKLNESIRAEMKIMEDARRAEQDVRDKAEEAEYAVQKAAAAAEAKLVAPYQRWTTLRDGTSKGATVLSLNKDNDGNYLSLIFFANVGLHGTVLSYQNPSRSPKKVLVPATVEFLLDRTNRLQLIMPPSRGDLVMTGSDIKHAVEFTSQVLIRITQANGDDFVYRFNTKGFPSTHFLTKIGGE